MEEDVHPDVGEETTQDTDDNTNDQIKCDEANCIQDEDIYKLECGMCSRLVHYRCTKLPPFQVQNFLIKGYRKYICINCVDVQKYISDAMPCSKQDINDQTSTIRIAYEKLEDRYNKFQEESRKKTAGR